MPSGQDAIDLAPQDRQEIAVALEDEVSSLDAKEGEALTDAIAADPVLTKLVSDAYVDAQKNALLAMVGVMLIALAIGSFLPGRHRTKEKAKPGARSALK